MTLKLNAHNHLLRRYNKQYLSVVKSIKQIEYDIDNTDDSILKNKIIGSSAPALVKLKTRADALKGKINALQTFERA
jgi:hypothetical protein